MTGLQNYEEVKDRIPLFWELYPEGRIAPNPMSDLSDITTVIFRCDLYAHKDDPTPFSTGWAFETQGVGGMANKYSHVENCETSAIGRALANANLYNKNKPRASVSEMRKVKRNEEATEEPFPVERLVNTMVTEKKETFSTSDLKERLNQLSDEQQASAKKWIAQDLRGVTTADGKLLSEVSAIQLAQLEEVYLKTTQ
jgi:hypothetical protein